MADQKVELPITDDKSEEKNPGIKFVIKKYDDLPRVIELLKNNQLVSLDMGFRDAWEGWEDWEEDDKVKAAMIPLINALRESKQLKTLIIDSIDGHGEPFHDMLIEAIKKNHAITHVHFSVERLTDGQAIALLQCPHLKVLSLGDAVDVTMMGAIPFNKTLQSLALHDCGDSNGKIYPVLALNNTLKHLALRLGTDEDQRPYEITEKAAKELLEMKGLIFLDLRDSKISEGLKQTLAASVTLKSSYNELDEQIQGPVESYSDAMAVIRLRASRGSRNSSYEPRPDFSLLTPKSYSYDDGDERESSYEADEHAQGSIQSYRGAMPSILGLRAERGNFYEPGLDFSPFFDDAISIAAKGEPASDIVGNPASMSREREVKIISEDKSDQKHIEGKRYIVTGYRQLDEAIQKLNANELTEIILGPVWDDAHFPFFPDEKSIKTKVNHLVEAIKNSKHLQKLSLISANSAFKEHYDSLIKIIKEKESITSVDFNVQDLSDKHAIALLLCPHIKTLSLGRLLGQATFGAIAVNTTLESLTLWGDGEMSISTLALNTTLKELTFKFQEKKADAPPPRFTKEMAKCLLEMKNLQSLDLRHYLITKDAMEVLVASQKLKSLAFHDWGGRFGCDRINYADILASNTSLKRILFYGKEAEKIKKIVERNCVVPRFRFTRYSELGNVIQQLERNELVEIIIQPLWLGSESLPEPAIMIAELNRLIKALENCRSLKALSIISEYRVIREYYDQIIQAVQRNSSIISLHIEMGANDLTRERLMNLFQCRHIKSLFLGGKISSDTIAAIATNNTIENLRFFDCTGALDQLFPVLALNPHLRSLTLGVRGMGPGDVPYHLTKEMAEELLKIKNLEALRVNGWFIEEDALKVFAASKKLRHLAFNDWGGRFGYDKINYLDILSQNTSLRSIECAGVQRKALIKIAERNRHAKNDWGGRFGYDKINYLDILSQNTSLRSIECAGVQRKALIKIAERNRHAKSDIAKDEKEIKGVPRPGLPQKPQPAAPVLSQTVEEDVKLGPQSSIAISSLQLTTPQLTARLASPAVMPEEGKDEKEGKNESRSTLAAVGEGAASLNYSMNMRLLSGLPSNNRDNRLGKRNRDNESDSGPAAKKPRNQEPGSEDDGGPAI